MASRTVDFGLKKVRPILSVDSDEARKRVFNLFRTWYRQIPYIVRTYDIPKSETQCRQKLKEEFRKHKDVTDIRVIDMLVIKAQMELKDVDEVWLQKGHVMNYFKDTIEAKPANFISKFLHGDA